MGPFNPNVAPTTFTFEWGPTIGYGNATPLEALDPARGTTTVGALLTGLGSGTTYHYRLVAASPVGRTVGADATFTTRIPAPVPPPDNDHDGFPQGVDCNDSNPAIHPGAVDRPGDRIDQDCNKIDAKWPSIGVRVFGFVHDLPRYSQFTGLTVTLAPKGAKITLTCRGGGCPFKKATRTQRRALKRIDLLPLLRKAKLRRHSVVELSVTKPAFVGVVTRWRVRAPARIKRTDLCLVPRHKLPGRC